MTGHQASRLATRVYLHLNLGRDQRALIRAPAPEPSVRAVPSLLTFLSTADYAEQQATSTPTDQHLHLHTRHNPVVGISRFMPRAA
jgi:hypothetical protein